jgi:hypothetical protein
MIRRSLVAIMLLAIVPVAGCGGSKGLSRQELIAKADPICRRANNALDSSKISQQNVAKIGPSVAAVEHQVAVELGKLTPASSMAHDWKVIVDGFRRAGSGIEEIGKALKSSNLSKPSPAFVQGEKELASGQNDRAEAAGRNGFSDCSKY